jgi:hypothetical protein
VCRGVSRSFACAHGMSCLTLPTAPILSQCNLQGKRFYGDLLADGQIRYSRGQEPDLDLVFPSPTNFNNFCGKLADPGYQKGNGFNYVFHKAPTASVWMPLDYYR